MKAESVHVEDRLEVRFERALVPVGHSARSGCPAGPVRLNNSS